MTHPSFIDWEKHRSKVADLIVGESFYGQPLLCVQSHELGIPKGVLFSFLPEKLRKTPVAWIVRDGKNYYVMSNCNWNAEVDFFRGVGKDGKPVIEKRVREEGVKYGPYKSLVSAVKKVRELAES